MMGYPSQTKGCKLWYLQSNRFIVSRDVYFKKPPCTSLSSPASNSEFSIPCSFDVNNHFDRIAGAQEKAPDSSEKNTKLQEKSDDVDSNPVTEPNSPERSLRRSTRQRKPPSEW